MKKFIIIIDGPMGSGKSTIAELVHKKLKRTALINTDKIKWFISDFKRGKRDNAINFSIMRKMCEIYLKNRINLLIPQGFHGKGITIQAWANLAKKFNAKIHIYHLDAPRVVLLNRIKSRRSAARTPIAKSRVLRNITAWKKKKNLPGKFLDSNSMTKEAVAKEILKDVPDLVKKSG